jgi:hypothetical protein
MGALLFLTIEYKFPMSEQDGRAKVDFGEFSRRRCRSYLF